MWFYFFTAGPYGLVIAATLKLELRNYS